MSFQNFISENIFLRCSDLLTGKPVGKNLKFLLQSQYWDREQIEQYQNEKLRQLISHAYVNVPFYNRLFKDLGLKPYDIMSKSDLVKLPIITKEALKKNKEKLLATNIQKKNLIYASSSGSTGEPFQFCTTKEADAFLRASAIRAWYQNGYRLGDKYVKMSMNPRGSSIKKLQDLFNNSLYLSSNQLSQSEFSVIWDKIREFNPSFIRSYPVPIQYLARYLKKNKIKVDLNNLLAINTTGSTLDQSVRSEVEEIFKVKVFDTYSCEGGAVFAQCPLSGNYHPSEEYAISEFIADNVTALDVRKPLRHITTDLHNYAFPFIRYDTQDYIVLGSDIKCNCGSDYKNIKNISGRDGDILKTPSGKLLIVENFVAYFEWVTEVDQIQVVQNQSDEIVIYLVVNKLYTPEVHQKISTFWQNYIGSDVNVVIKIVDEIKLTFSGKRRTLIRNPQIKLHD
jgi:phenylacetate-CoA ligase